MSALIGAVAGGVIAALVARSGRHQQVVADKAARILSLTSAIVGSGRRILRGLDNGKAPHKSAPSARWREPSFAPPSPPPTGVQIAEAEILRDSVELSALLPGSHLVSTALELVDAITDIVRQYDTGSSKAQWAGLQQQVVDAQGELDAELTLFAGLSFRDTRKYFTNRLPENRPQR